MTTGDERERVDRAAERAVELLTAAGIAAMVYIGDRLGLYQALAGAGPIRSQQLAFATGLDERWVREWLHGQASAGIVQYSGNGLYELPPAQAVVLADEESPDFLAGGFALLFPLLRGTEPIAECFRSGRGLRYDDHGRDHAVGESRFSAPWMRANLVSTIIPAIAGLHEKLAAGGRAVDIGCGVGKALVEMARAYPQSEFHGYDSSEVAISLAREQVAGSGLENITLHQASGDSVPAAGKFDFVLAWDCLHDMTDPAATMRAIRQAIEDDGAWLIVDVNGAATPEENYSNPLAPLLYSFSVLDCLPCGTSQPGAAGLGTLGLPEPLVRRMAAEAGFTRFTVHDFGNPINAFYEVRP